MRSSRLIVLALAAVALAGCMQSGGSGIFARNAPPLAHNRVVLPDGWLKDPYDCSGVGEDAELDTSGG